MNWKIMLIAACTVLFLARYVGYIYIDHDHGLCREWIEGLALQEPYVLIVGACYGGIE